MTLYEILAVIAVVTLVIYASFNIIYLIDLRRTSLAIRQFIARTEENLNPALAELRLALADIRKVSADISALTDRARSVTGTLIRVEKTIEQLYSFYRQGFSQSANMAALKAGVTAGVVNLVKNLKTKKEGSS